MERLAMLGFVVSGAFITLAAVVVTRMLMDWPRDKQDYLMAGLVWSMVVMMWLALWSTWGRI